MTLLVLAILTPLVPIVTVALFSRSGGAGRLVWYLDFVTAASVITIFYVIGTWVFVSYYLRYAVAITFLIVSFVRFLVIRHQSLVPSRHTASRTTLLVRIAAAVITLWLAVLVYAGHAPPAGTLDLSFPLRDGSYCIIQGGRNFVTNPFHNFVDSEHAVDIVKINRAGNRADGISPRDRSAYHIYDEPVYSPHDGIVVTVVDTIEDNVPPRANAISPLGNHVIVAFDNVRVIVAHLRKGSTVVDVGQPVKRDDLIGRVGNSGYSNEPHLHVQVLRDGGEDGDGGVGSTGNVVPVPIRFDGRYVAINDIVRR